MLREEGIREQPVSGAQLDSAPSGFCLSAEVDIIQSKSICCDKFIFVKMVWLLI